jgi:hypothetical protein
LSSRAKTDYPQVVPWKDVETSFIAVGTWSGGISADTNLQSIAYESASG